MNRIHFAIVIALALLAGGTTLSYDCEAGTCIGPRPICMYPDKPLCLCKGFSVSSCRWVCAH